MGFGEWFLAVILRSAGLIVVVVVVVGSVGEAEYIPFSFVAGSVFVLFTVACVPFGRSKSIRSPFFSCT